MIEEELTGSFPDLIKQLDLLGEEIKKPFKYNIDSNSLRIEVDRRIKMYR